MTVVTLHIFLRIATHVPPSAVSKDTENSDDESEKPNKRKDVSSPWAAASTRVPLRAPLRVPLRGSFKGSVKEFL